MSEAPRDSLTSWRKNLRTFPCFNTTTEVIPSYAIMQLRKPAEFKENKGFSNTSEKDEFAVQHISGGRIIWDVTKPNEEGESRQCAEDFVFNGPVPIEPQQPGVCTQDYPCQVLHNGDNDQLLNGQPCGPVRDRWYVLSGGSAFACKSHDVGFAAGRGLIHTIWIDRANRTSVIARGRFAVPASDLAVGEFAPISTGTLVSNTVETEGEWVTVQRDGLYLVSFHGKMTSSDAARGNELKLTLYTKPADDEDGTEHDPEATPYIASRDQDIEKDAGVDIQTTGENVAFTGFVSLSAGDMIGLKNTCAKLVTLSNAMLTVMHMGAKIEEPASSDDTFDTSQS
jgi:hypothetical protein